MPTQLRFAAILLGTACLLGTVGASFAQRAEPKSTDCTETPATRLEKGADSGSKNMGTTGWSGGMREPGSGAASDKEPSKSPGQPTDTAKGIDPTKPDANKPATC